MTHTYVPVSTFLRISIATASPLYVTAVSEATLKTKETRIAMANLLRQGFATVVAPRIYGYADILEAVAAKQYVGDKSFLFVPPAHETAIALCEQNHWQLAIPDICAKFLLGLSSRPCDLQTLPYNQDIQRSYDRARLSLIPSLNYDFYSPAVRQILAMGLPKDASEAALKRIGKVNSRGFLGDRSVLKDLYVTIKADMLGEKERVVAEAIIEAAENTEIPTRAPEDFVPPDDLSTIPLVDRWHVVVQNDAYGRGNRAEAVIVARSIVNHPIIPDGHSMHTSPILWIDERVGFARTFSRLYRLGEKAS